MPCPAKAASPNPGCLIQTDPLPKRGSGLLSIVAARVINFDQTDPNNSPQTRGLLIRLGDYGKSEE
jgi:hypothetical protein